MHIRVINPVITRRWENDTLRTYSSVAQEGTQVSVVSLDWGTASIESQRDEALVVPDILTKVVQAEQDGVDAVIVDCMADPGVPAARELVRIPVVGPAQASMHLAAMLGHRFSVITVFDSDIPAVEDQVLRYGLTRKLASVRAFNIPVLDLDQDRDATVRVLADVSERAVREDGAHVIVPGCTGLGGLAARIQAALRDRGLDVPVLDPPLVAMKLAESLVTLGYAHSKVSYPAPPDKEIRWFAPWGTITA
ncbi:MAG: hydrogenase expression protein HupH [Chloroflexi bacterium]|nr:hydrogenase expression protein HupH [Chloroflexota bacterium]